MNKFHSLCWAVSQHTSNSEIMLTDLTRQYKTMQAQLESKIEHLEAQVKRLETNLGRTDHYQRKIIIMHYRRDNQRTAESHRGTRLHQSREGPRSGESPQQTTHHGEIVRIHLPRGIWCTRHEDGESPTEVGCTVQGDGENGTGCSSGVWPGPEISRTSTRSEIISACELDHPIKQI